MSTIGHNSTAGGVSAGELRAYIERIERLEEEKSNLAGDIRDVYAEAKANGFDTRIMRQVIRRRRMDPDDRREYDSLLELYEQSVAALFE